MTREEAEQFLFADEPYKLRASQLLPAVIQQESGGNPNAISPKGARNITQIMPATAFDPGFGVIPLRDQSPEEYRRMGRDYLAAMLERYKGNERLALAANNAGPGRVDQYQGIPPFKETRDYVSNILHMVNPMGTAMAAEQMPQQRGMTREEALNYLNSPDETPAPAAPGTAPSISPGGTSREEAIAYLNAPERTGKSWWEELPTPQAFAASLSTPEARKELINTAVGVTMPQSWLKTLPRRLLASAGTGAASGETLEEKGKGALAGLALGGAGEAAGKLAGGLLASRVSPEAKQLMAEGVNVTPGQALQSDTSRLGQMIRGFEDKLKAFSISKPIIQAAERGAFADWTNARLKQVAPEGYKLKFRKGDPLGSGIDEVAQAFNSKYNDILGNTFIKLDDKGLSDLADIEKKYSAALGSGLGGKENFVHELSGPGGIVDQLIQEGGYPGNQFKLLEGDIRDSKSAAFRAGNKVLADAYNDVLQTVKSIRDRSLPTDKAAELAPLDRQYSKFLRVQDAASMLGAQTSGAISPGHLLGAAKRMSNKPTFARGKAIMQPESLLAQKVMGSTIPPIGPGTAEKILPALMMMAKSGLIYAEPVLGSLAALATSKPGLKAMLGGYPQQEAIENAIRQVPPSLSYILGEQVNR